MSHLFKDKIIVVVAKLGYASRGLIYVVIGSLSLLAALSGASDGTNSKEALNTLFNQPFGRVMLISLIIGLVCYSFWRALQSITDTDDHGLGPKGIAIRGGLFTSCVSHLVLAYWCIKLLTGNQSGGESTLKQWLESDIGQWVIAAVGICIVGAGIAHLIKSLTSKFADRMDIPKKMKLIVFPICYFGLFARGIIWCMVGWFTFYSAWLARDGEIKGMEDALSTIQQQAFGAWLLGVSALGLLAFGLYSFLESVYRKINFGDSQ